LKESLEKEAKKFAKQKRKTLENKALTSRIYLAGQALTGLLAGARSSNNMQEIKRQAYDWADYMLDDDT
jgi:hypothetical protein|tara:strand:- start:1047 stop:1253 length:207 start_codon:yes stop_codon:yes gene_type:complete